VGQLGGVTQSSLDVGWFQGRIAPENLFLGGTFGEAVEDYGDWNTRADGADFSSQNIRITLEEVWPRDHEVILAGFRRHGDIYLRRREALFIQP
jgi:hypothetical protein